VTTVFRGGQKSSNRWQYSV